MKILKNIEWKKFTLIEAIPEKYGVYIIACHCSDDADYVIYTGQSNNLRRRIQEHWSDNETNKELKYVIKKYSSTLSVYCAEANGNSVDGIERFLFNTYNPQLQDRAPEVEPQPVNLPDVKRGKVNFN